MSEAQLVFTNGAGLEEFMQRLIENAGGEAHIVPLSDGLDLITASPDVAEHGGFDPHVWLDPANIARWVPVIEDSLSELDPANTATYQENAARYLEALQELDSWIEEQVSQIRRRGARSSPITWCSPTLPGATALNRWVQPYPHSARWRSLLPRIWPRWKIKSARVESRPSWSARRSTRRSPSASPAIPASRWPRFNSGSLSPPDGPAPTYLEFMRYNVNAIVQALR